MERNCMRCGRTIGACFGFVLVRDLLLALDKLIPYTKVREHCGICCEKITLLDDKSKAEYFNSIPNIV